ncbi:MAG TPA: hypothetical protein VNO26_14275 [Candidatus Limnocylindria bacterium]|nr:hypothetical protein [Candidatus Limnocylindria bacterium]
MRRGLLLFLSIALAVPGAGLASPDCDGAWIRKAKVNAKRGKLDLVVNVVRPETTHDTFVGAAGLQLRVVDVASGTTVHELDVPRAAFVTRGKRTRASGGDVPGSVTIARAAGQADAVSLRLRLAGAVLTAAPFDLRVELASGTACARSCLSACASGKKKRLRCAPSMAYRPFADLGFGDFTGPAKKRPATSSPFCGLSVDPTPGCDPLIEERCVLPFPSSRFLVPDATTPTGLRVHYGPTALPANVDGKHVDPTDWNRLDGFSPAPLIIALFPDTGAPVDLAASGVAPQTDFARSLDDDHPIVIMKAATGERVPHFAELDANTEEVDERALLIRPGTRLEDGTRYIVAIRNLVDTAGTPVRPRLVFRALRDADGAEQVKAACGSPCGALIDERKAAFDDVFATLAAHGVDPAELVLAWDFTTASTEALTGWLVSIRDQAFALPTPAFTVTTIDDGEGEGFSDDIYRRVEGTFQAPLFMTADAPASRLNLVDGMPVQNGWATVPFVVDIPRLAFTGEAEATPLRASLWGHGLLGDRYQLGALARSANTYGFIAAAVDMQGMASEDVGPAIVPLIADFSLFHYLPERLHQGLLHHLLLGRLLGDPEAGFNSDPAFQLDDSTPIIDTSEVYYSGGSQGGIYGLTIMAVAENFSRGFLAVPGANYSTLLHRAAPFRPFFTLLNASYPDRLDQQILVALVQQQWDRVDPIAYLPHVVPGTLSTPPHPHRVLLHMARCDSQVSNLATEIAVRSLGIPQVAPAIRSFFGIPEASAPIDGSALLEIDWQRCGARCNVPGADDPGAPCTTDADCPGAGDHPGRTRCDSGTPPLANLIPPFDNGAHGAESDAEPTDPVPRQVAEFLKTGVVNQHCDGTCDPD